jgi:hypothetical protein
MNREIISYLESHYSKGVTLVRQERPYKIPRGFIQWDRLSAVVGASLALFNDPPTIDPTQVDRATYLLNYALCLWFLRSAPMYALRGDLFKAFDNSDVGLDSGLLADLRPPVNPFILLFPSNSLISAEGAPLDWVVVNLTSRDRPEDGMGEGYGYSLPLLRIEGNMPRNLNWGGVDSKEVSWFGGSGIDEAGNLVQGTKSLGSERMGPSDHGFTARVRNVVLQTMLALTYRPDLLEAEELVATPRRSPRAKPKASTPPTLTPRYLTSPVAAPQKARGGGAGAGTHASPTAHWRRGHWRRVPVGERESGGRKWVWIQPTFVNG